jgi:hypothetical protein
MAGLLNSLMAILAKLHGATTSPTSLPTELRRNAHGNLRYPPASGRFRPNRKAHSDLLIQYKHKEIAKK